MEFPLSLRMELEKRAAVFSTVELLHAAQQLSERYRRDSGQGKRLLTTGTEAVAYSLVRMPATFGAVSSALENGRSALPDRPLTLLDVGAGSGAASWAADGQLELAEVTCLERETAMRQLGQELMRVGSPALKNAYWKKFDIVLETFPGQADLVIASYLLNELSDLQIKKAALRLWEASKEALLLVEPGTPVGFRQLKELRDLLLQSDAHIAAPCPGDCPCPLSDEDWCHFTCRVARSRIHRILKSGDAPYEDEKFSYLLLTKNTCTPAQSRVLRHPRVDTGRITLQLCTAEGLCCRTFRKKDGSLYRQARKVQSGSEFAVEEHK